MIILEHLDYTMYSIHSTISIRNLIIRVNIFKTMAVLNLIYKIKKIKLKSQKILKFAS